jgi:hypothetical protein
MHREADHSKLTSDLDSSKVAQYTNSCVFFTHSCMDQ